MTSRNITVLTLGLCEFCHSFSFHCHAIKSKKWKSFNTESPQSGKRKKINKQKNLARNDVCAILHMPEFGKIFAQIYKALYGDAILVSLWGAQIWRPETKKASVFEFSLKIVNTSLKEFMKIKVIFILRQGMFRKQNLKKLVTFLAHTLRAFSAVSWMQCHAKAKKFKRPLSENQEPFQTERFYK